MKRPPGLWILLSAGVLWLCLQDVYGIRATALIFGKSTTSTTTEPPTTPLAEDRIDSESDSDAPSNSTSESNNNSTTPALTGNPQIDYLWDPNLPKELNGYNLSDYPFYERVPDEKFDFKCDGLHDGFYASIPHKCQVYHHCLFGTRYDFLCANYTAFDQKTFICQFVSEVDCENSKKFWHRNDALYQTQSTTTTAAPNLRAAIYTTAPSNGGDPVTPAPSGPAGGRRPYRRRPRPQVEYYDDEYYDDEYYEERPRANRGRPMRRPSRPRPRPAYDDDYEEYEDERYESRRSNSRRRPYRDRRKNKDRRRPAEYDEDEEVDDRFEDEDFVEAPKRPKPQKQRPQDAADKPKRKPARKQNRRPAYDEEYDEDDLPQSDDSRSYEDRPKKNKSKKEEATGSDGRPIIKSSTGTIYDRPRLAPRINLPVPKNAADKFSYKTLGGGAKASTTTTAAPPKEEEEEYEEVEEPPKRSNRRPAAAKKPKNEDSKSQQSASRPISRRKPEQEVVVVVEKSTPKPKYSSNNNNNRYQRKRPKPPVQPQPEVEEEEYDDEEEDVQERRPSQKYESKRTSTTTTTTTTTTTEAPKREPIMRIIKRPFLPSRGGDPYTPRGLKPIGLKAVESQEAENESEETVDDEKQPPAPEEDYPEEPRPTKTFKPSPVIVKVPARQKFAPPTAEAPELIDLEPVRLQNYQPRPTQQRPKAVEKNPIYDEYDVTLNDALNPTLPNLPARGFPTGFSSPGGGGGVADYYARQRYVLEPAAVVSQNYALQNNKVVRSSPQRQTQAIYSRY